MSLTVYIKDKSTQTKSGRSGHTSDRVYSRGLQWSWKNHKMLPEAKFKSTSTKVRKKILGAQQEIMGFTMPVAHIRAGVVEEELCFAIKMSYRRMPRPGIGRISSASRTLFEYSLIHCTVTFPLSSIFIMFAECHSS